MTRYTIHVFMHAKMDAYIYLLVNNIAWSLLDFISLKSCDLSCSNGSTAWLFLYLLVCRGWRLKEGSTFCRKSGYTNYFMFLNVFHFLPSDNRGSGVRQCQQMSSGFASMICIHHSIILSIFPLSAEDAFL